MNADHNDLLDSSKPAGPVSIFDRYEAITCASTSVTSSGNGQSRIKRASFCIAASSRLSAQVSRQQSFHSASSSLYQCHHARTGCARSMFSARSSLLAAETTDGSETRGKEDPRPLSLHRVGVSPLCQKLHQIVDYLERNQCFERIHMLRLHRVHDPCRNLPTRQTVGRHSQYH